MNEIKSFTLYREYYDLITLLSEKEQANVLLAMVKYVFDGEEFTLTDRENKVFINLKRPLDKSKSKSQNANKTKSNQNQNEIETKSKEDTHHDVNVYVNNNVLEDKGYGEKKPFEEIINYLNQKTNSHYKFNSKTTQTKINARLNEGYKLDDFIAVIDKKYAEWKGTEFEQYLCPETLFGTKFEKYLNQKTSGVKRVSTTEWLGKEFESQEATDEEIAELEKRMKR